MSTISFRHKGNYSKASRYLEKLRDVAKKQTLDKYAKMAVELLASATPKDTGKTAASWTYEIESSSGGSAIHFMNTNVNKGVNIAIILQYGHGTRNGGYVQGRDYINPASKAAFDKIVEDLWREVTAI